MFYHLWSPFVVMNLLDISENLKWQKRIEPKQSWAHSTNNDQGPNLSLGKFSGQMLDGWLAIWPWGKQLAPKDSPRLAYSFHSGFSVSCLRLLLVGKFAMWKGKLILQLWCLVLTRGETIFQLYSPPSSRTKATQSKLAIFTANLA